MTLVQLAATAAGTLVSRTGAPVPGATLSVYETQTVTPIAVWADRAGSVALTQPLTTDGSGQAPGWAQDGQTVDFVYSFDGASADPLTAELVSAQSAAGTPPSPTWALIQWALGETFRLVSVTRNASEVVTSASVVWPDGATGTLTATTINATFNTVDAYTLTYTYTPSGGLPVTRTITQPAVTRDSGGAVTAQPALTVV